MPRPLRTDPALRIEPDPRLRLRLRADKTALVRDAAAEPRAIPRKRAAKLLLAGIERFAFLCKFRFALALGQFLHHAQRDGKLHPRPDALALSLAADLVEHVVPVGAEHQREAVRAHVLRGEADGLFDVLPDRAAAAVEIRGLRVKVRNVSLFQRDVIGVHDQPEVVIRVDARDRLPALGGEEISYLNPQSCSRLYIVSVQKIAYVYFACQTGTAPKRGLFAP